MASPFTHDDEDLLSHPRQIIGIDFGTTYTSVSYVNIPAGRATESVERNEIKLISGYPGTNYGQREGPVTVVPSEVIYPLDPNFRDNNESAFEPDYPDDDEVQTFKWGYHARDLLSRPATHSDPSNLPLQHFKLLLHDGPTTAEIRAKLNVTLDTLKQRKVIESHLDPITDFMTHVMRHVESELSADYGETWRREIVLSVPAIWTRKACREMQKCLAMAMERANFKGVTVLNNSIQNLFLVSEPEGGADYAGAPEVKADDPFILVDAGGGTSDAITFQVTSEEPLRLKQEVVAAAGGLYGSSFINEGFREWLRDILSEETYLENKYETIHGIVEQVIVNQFEGHIKRNHDIYDDTLPEVRVVIHNLRDNRNLRFRQSCVVVPRNVLINIFEKCFKGIWTILEDQLNKASDAGIKVEKVILIGGFGSNKCLGVFLNKRLEEYNRHNQSRVELLQPGIREYMHCAVSSGAVYRACNKANGPKRIAQCSYGILGREEYTPKRFPSHKAQDHTTDPLDGRDWVHDIMTWILKKGNKVPPVWEEQYPTVHTLGLLRNVPLTISQELFVSDTAKTDHYPINHWRNRGTEKFGELEVDVSFLRDRGLLTPTPAPVRRGVTVGKDHYVIPLMIRMRVIGRDLTCTAIFKDVHGNLHEKRCQINIASAFMNGVE